MAALAAAAAPAAGLADRLSSMLSLPLPRCGNPADEWCGACGGAGAALGGGPTRTTTTRRRQSGAATRGTHSAWQTLLLQHGGRFKIRKTFRRCLTQGRENQVTRQVALRARGGGSGGFSRTPPSTTPAGVAARQAAEAAQSAARLRNHSRAAGGRMVEVEGVGWGLASRAVKLN